MERACRLKGTQGRLSRQRPEAIERRHDEEHDAQCYSNASAPVHPEDGVLVVADVVRHVREDLVINWGWVVFLVGGVDRGVEECGADGVEHEVGGVGVVAELVEGLVAGVRQHLGASVVVPAAGCGLDLLPVDAVYVERGSVLRGVQDDRG